MSKQADRTPLLFGLHESRYEGIVRSLDSVMLLDISPGRYMYRMRA